MEQQGVPHFGSLNDENTSVEIREKVDNAINGGLWRCFNEVKKSGSATVRVKNITVNKEFLQGRVDKKLKECKECSPPPNDALKISVETTFEPEDYGIVGRSQYGIWVSYSIH